MAIHRDGDAESNDYSGLAFDNIISEIGYDWKTYTGTWDIIADRAYFVMDADTNFYKIVFTAFGGSANGLIAFSKTDIDEASSLAENTSESVRKISVSPNPVEDETHVVLYNTKQALANCTLMDITGKTIWHMQKQFAQGLNNFKLNMNNFSKGIYLLKINDENGTVVQKIYKQ